MTTPAKASEMFPKVSPWPEGIDLSNLLDEINATIKRFIACEPETAQAATLWIAFTWIIDHVQIAPLALITAPEKRCGKTQLLTLMGRLVARSVAASNITASALFRTVDKYRPTLLLDEADTYLRDNEELRGVVNSGHTRSGASIIRNTGESFEPKRFSTWCAKVICGIGTQHDTIMDRAIRLELRRKLANEKVERLRHAESDLFERLQRMLARFAQDHGPAIGKARPHLPEELSDRAQDNWEPLLAIADLAGKHWPSQARKAAIRLSGEEESLSLGVELLRDIREVFETQQMESLRTHDLLNALGEKEDAPWTTYSRGMQMRPYALAKLLKGFGIASAKIRFGTATAQGYRRSDFQDAWGRYLPASPEDDEAHEAARKGRVMDYAGYAVNDVPF